MKKIFSVFAAMALALSAFMFTGCDEIAEQLPIYDTWYNYDYTYEGSSGTTVEFRVYLNYQKDGITVSTKDKKKLKVDFEDGLNVVLVPGADTDNAALEAIATGLTHNMYIYKTFAEGDDFGGSAMNKTKWSIIKEYLDTKGDAFDERGSTLPDVLTSSVYSPFDVSEGFDWKHILINALVNSAVD